MTDIVFNVVGRKKRCKRVHMTFEKLKERYRSFRPGQDEGQFTPADAFLLILPQGKLWSQSEAVH